MRKAVKHFDEEGKGAMPSLVISGQRDKFRLEKEGD
jgi:hypothetical protein